ncbi:MAG: Gfo/Idh/MocA family oxidoreductase [Chitinophagaceae bacterium]
MSNKIKFAVVGCGHIGKRHAEMIYRNKDATLTAIVDIKNKEELGIEEYQVPFFNSLEALLEADIKPDVINIATPNGLHASQAIQCLDAGTHVVIEKPFALSTTAAAAVILKSQQVKKNVFVVMQNRYSPPCIWLKEILESKKLGKIFLVQVNCFWNRDERYYKPDSWHGTKNMDGGTLFTQFSHFIDLLYWCFGDINNIQTRFNDFNHKGLTDFEDSGLVYFDFVNGGMGSLHYSTAVWDKNMESSITVIAENGSLKIGGQYMNEVIYCHIKDYVMPSLPATNPVNDYGAYKGSAANHHFVIENVVEVLKNNLNISMQLNESQKVVDIIERIYAQRV